MNVERVMSNVVRSCTPDHPLACAAQLMWEGDCGCVPIVDDGGHVMGMITDRDICMATYLNARIPQELRVGDFMSRDVLACSPHDTIADATAMMRRAQVRRLPVADAEGRLVGILSLTDVATVAARPGNGHDGGSTMLDVGLTLGAVGRPRGQPVAMND
jgi:CBS domain-containing protein